MSRRYGRKQRRAAREQIAERDQTIWDCRQALLREGIRSSGLARTAERLRESIQLWDSEIRSLLGPYTSFAIDEPTYRVDHPDQIRQMPVIPPLRLNLSGVYSMEESISYHIETMLGFMCGLDERDLERLRRLLTVRVAVGRDYLQGEAYYAVSEEMWHQMKRDGPNNPGLERFIHRIAGDLVRLLVAPPKKKPSGDDLVPAMERDMRLRNLKDQGL